MKEFIRLMNENGDIYINRVKDIREMQSLDNGERCRIWWGDNEEGEDYETSFIIVAEYLDVNVT